MVRRDKRKENTDMNKEPYERSEIEIIAFRTDDILTTSGDLLDEYEVDIING